VATFPRDLLLLPVSVKSCATPERLMQPPTPTPESRRRSRLWLTVFLIVVIALAIGAAIIIERGLGDEDLQEQLRELREDAR